MQVNLSSDNYSIISNGTTFLFGEDKDLIIEVTADNGFQFTLAMEFKTDDNSESRIDTKFYEKEICISVLVFFDILFDSYSPETIVHAI